MAWSDAVEAAPALVELARSGAEVGGVGDVELEDVGRCGQALGHPLGQAHGPAERGEHDLGALLLGAAGAPRRRWRRRSAHR